MKVVFVFKGWEGKKSRVLLQDKVKFNWTLAYGDHTWGRVLGQCFGVPTCADVIMLPATK